MRNVLQLGAFNQSLTSLLLAVRNSHYQLPSRNNEIVDRDSGNLVNPFMRVTN